MLRAPTQWTARGQRAPLRDRRRATRARQAAADPEVGRAVPAVVTNSGNEQWSAKWEVEPWPGVRIRRGGRGRTMVARTAELAIIGGGMDPRTWEFFVAGGAG